MYFILLMNDLKISYRYNTWLLNISVCIPNKRKLLLDGNNTIPIPNNVWFLLVWFFYLLFPCMFCSFNYEFNFLATLAEAILCLFPGTFGNSQQSNFQLPTSKHFTLEVIPVGPRFIDEFFSGIPWLGGSLALFTVLVSWKVLMSEGQVRQFWL